MCLFVSIFSSQLQSTSSSRMDISLLGREDDDDSGLLWLLDQYAITPGSTEQEFLDKLSETHGDAIQQCESYKNKITIASEIVKLTLGPLFAVLFGVFLEAFWRKLGDYLALLNYRQPGFHFAYNIPFAKCRGFPSQLIFQFPLSEL